MTQPIDDKEVRKYIEAFADGELDVEQNLRMLEHMAMNPRATRRVMHQQQLRQAVDRAMRESTPAIPQPLRGKIEQLAAEWDGRPARQENTTKPARPTRPGVIAKIGRWLPAVAAALLLGASIVLFVLSQSPGGGDPLLETRHIRAASFVARHNACSKQLENLHRADAFGTQIADIPGKVAERFDLSATLPVLDLSSLGYAFAGAGDCAAPGAAAVHLVFRADDGPGAISIWVRPAADSDGDIEPGKLYAAAPRKGQHPLLMWRRGDVIYYLIGDDADKVREAARLLAAK